MAIKLLGPTKAQKIVNHLDALLGQMKDVDASDLHLTAGEPPKYRIRGDMVHIEGWPVLTHEMLLGLLRELVETEEQFQTYLKDRDFDFAYAIEGYGRYRSNYLWQQNGCAAVFRLIPTKMLSFQDLGLPLSVLQFLELGTGLVLVTGPTGSGKTTTLASLINYINENYHRHIITLEDPLEFVHPPKKCIVTHREVHTHTHSFANALRSAMRMDPDVILVGEMRDPETISMALTCAEMGVLVFGTLHTNSASKTVDRIIDVFPAEEQSRVRTMLSGSLRGVVAQQLCRRADKPGRVAAFEIMVGSRTLGALIRSGETSRIDSYLQGGGNLGMQTMDSHLMKLLNDGKISGQEAYQKAFDKSMFEQFWSFDQEAGH